MVRSRALLIQIIWISCQYFYGHVKCCTCNESIKLNACMQKNKLIAAMLTDLDASINNIIIIEAFTVNINSFHHAF